MTTRDGRCYRAKHLQAAFEHDNLEAISDLLSPSSLPCGRSRRPCYLTFYSRAQLYFACEKWHIQAQARLKALLPSREQEALNNNASLGPPKLGQP